MHAEGGGARFHISDHHDARPNAKGRPHITVPETTLLPRHRPPIRGEMGPVLRPRQFLALPVEALALEVVLLLGFVVVLRRDKDFAPIAQGPEIDVVHCALLLSRLRFDQHVRLSRLHIEKVSNVLGGERHLAPVGRKERPPSGSGSRARDLKACNLLEVVIHHDVPAIDVLAMRLTVRPGKEQVLRGASHEVQFMCPAPGPAGLPVQQELEPWARTGGVHLMDPSQRDLMGEEAKFARWLHGAIPFHPSRGRIHKENPRGPVDARTRLPRLVLEGAREQFDALDVRALRRRGCRRRGWR